MDTLKQISKVSQFSAPIGVAAIKNLNLESDAMKVISKATLSAPKINPALGDPR